MRAIWTAAAIGAALSLTSVTVATAAVPLRDPDDSRVLAAPAAPRPLGGLPAPQDGAGPAAPSAPKAPAAPSGPAVPSMPGEPSFPGLVDGRPVKGAAAALPTLPALPTGLALPTGAAAPDTSALLKLLNGLLSTIGSLLSGLGLPITIPTIPGLGG
ncbi:hypothetical protein [Kitasatospora viridis]|uniref:Uncharacterized protein n=1 Tax=Kitasatospora viridis TaxID=281105 RepID=A0A561UKC4_9ACTN|nr:hypothetical protein [Kitasatospora viridis]TWF99817.1 hypothetical protein FHX73_113673 [Kitasatospora viridis]